MASTNLSRLPIGTVLGEKYRVTREIGRGGMAAVYEAENVDIGKRVAVKVLAPELTGSTVVVERFLREARAAASISSPNICDVYDSGKLEDDRPFLVLELLEGESLYEHMTRVRQLTVEKTLAITTQAARGLMKAHAASVVHRDLKPENIFLTKDADGELLVKILDFGLAKFYAPMVGDVEQARLTREGAVFGTPAYMSPEQVKGQGQVDHRADLWALGCIVFECLTGRTVWSTDQGVAMTFAQIASAPLPNALQYRPDLPPSFQVWFAKALAHSIEDRFQTAKELADSLVVAVFEDVPRVLSMKSLTEVAAAASAALPLKTPMASPVAAGVAFTASAGHTPHELPARTISSGRGSGEGAGPPGRSQPSNGMVSSSVEPRPAHAAAQSQHRLRAILTIVGVGAIAAGGYVAWLVLLRPSAVPVARLSVPSADASAVSQITAASEAPSAAISKGGPKWLTVVESAQAQVAAGDIPGAIRTLQDVQGNSPARQISDQLQIAAKSKGPCRLTGIGRPRPAGAASTPGRPAIAFTPRGALVVWTDSHESAATEHAYSILLDPALRAVGEVHDLTPESSLVSSPQLFVVGDKIVILYSDGKGTEAGVHARWLDAEGKISSPPRSIVGRKTNSAASLDRAPDGTFWVAWEDERRTDASSDLYVRHLGADLEPIAPEIRATDYVGKGKPRVRYPAIGIAGNHLTVAYRLERDPLHQLLVQRFTAAELSAGLDSVAEKAPPKDRRIGEFQMLSSDRSKADVPKLDCTTEGCYAAWQADDGAGLAAYLESTRGQILWRKRVDPKAARPTVAIAPSGVAEISWLGRNRLLHFASIAREGVGVATPIARVSGDPPAPGLASGGAPGEWYATWLDSEGNRPEVYVVRVLCK